MNSIEQPFEFGKLTEEQLEQTLSQLQLEIPTDYQNFLLENNGGYPTNSVIRLKDGKFAEVQYFLAINSKNEYANLEKAIKRMKGRIPKQLIPIAINSGGDYYCLGVSGERVGKVYIWRHDFEAEDDGSNFYGNVTEIAESFDDFFNSLVIDD